MINVLPFEIFNLIAAGEVIENPSSIVKELVENSIDAGSHNISIYIEDGGIKSISIIDDGIGIKKEEIHKTILPHATSKIQNADDIFTVATLGFRGEALASISEVSEFELISRYYKEKIGARLYKKSNNQSIDEISANIGTRIVVKNLFYNTPARFRFLSSSKSEENKITKLVIRLMLSNPDIAFRYFIENTLTLSSEGKGLDNVIKSIYSNEIIENLIRIDNSDNNIHISGYISSPKLSRNNRNEQLIIVNERIIENMQISASIQNAYGDRLMKRKFPMFVLNIIMPFEDVDINVHPNKKEVRFSKSNKLLGTIYRTIINALEKYEKDEVLDNAKILHANIPILDLPESFEKMPPIKYNDTPNHINNDISANNNESISSFDYNNTSDKTKDSLSDYSFFDFYIEKEKNLDLDDVITNENRIITKNKLIDNSYEILGQVFDTYIVVKFDKYIYFIDQHAAHERILFDEIIYFYENNKVIVQTLLVPIILDVSYDQIELLKKHCEHFKKLGFNIDIFGANSIKINSVPAVLYNKIDYQIFIDSILEQIELDAVINLSDLAKDLFASKACKAAMKGNTYLNNDQISQIFEYFINNNFPMQCPHGRPTYIKFSKVDFEKLFKRI